MTTVSKPKKEPKGYFMLPSVARERLLNVMPTDVLINCVALDDEILNDCKAFCRKIIDVTVDVGDEIKIKIKFEGIGYFQHVPLPECYLKCKTPEEQLAYLAERFNCAITLFFNNRSHFPESIYELVKGMNVVCVNCCECGRDRSKEALELLPASTKEVMVHRYPQIENFEGIFAKSFDYLEFHCNSNIKLNNILVLKCKDIDIWTSDMTEAELITLLEAWVGGWNPLMNMCCIQVLKKKFQGDFLTRLLSRITHTTLPTTEAEFFTDKSFLWTAGHKKMEGVFMIFGKLEGNKKRSAKLIVDSIGAVYRFKFLVQK